MKKYFVLGVLFLLPITAYLFFSSGTNYFKRLPVLTENVSELNDFETYNESIQLQDNLTILFFAGDDFKNKFVNIFNLTHKIYKPFYEFEDLQFVVVLKNGNEQMVDELLKEIEKITNPSKWRFVFGEASAIKNVFASMQTNLQLNENLASSYSFIIDKERSLRGRDDDEKKGILYGYNTSLEAELNNTMKDDIKVLLAEYRLALKKNKKRAI